PPPGTQIQAVLIFSSNGRLSGPPIPVGLPDDSPVGTWSVIHGNFFSYQFKMHEFYDAQHLQLKDTVYVNQVGILSPNGNTWSSTGPGTVFDPNGSLIEADITSSVATRAS